MIIIYNITVMLCFVAGEALGVFVLVVVGKGFLLVIVESSVESDSRVINHRLAQDSVVGHWRVNPSINRQHFIYRFNKYLIIFNVDR